MTSADRSVRFDIRARFDDVAVGGIKPDETHQPHETTAAARYDRAGSGSTSHSNDSGARAAFWNPIRLVVCRLRSERLATRNSTKYQANVKNGYRWRGALPALMGRPQPSPPYPLPRGSPRYTLIMVMSAVNRDARRSWGPRRTCNWSRAEGAPSGFRLSLARINVRVRLYRSSQRRCAP